MNKELSDIQFEKLFKRLSNQWKEETMFLSSMRQISIHPAYQQIIALGPRVIPLIFKELEKELDFWFYALRELTGEDPITEDMHGEIMKIRKAWLIWGKEHGYLE